MHTPEIHDPQKTKKHKKQKNCTSFLLQGSGVEDFIDSEKRVERKKARPGELGEYAEYFNGMIRELKGEVPSSAHSSIDTLQRG